MELRGSRNIVLLDFKATSQTMCIKLAKNFLSVFDILAVEYS